MQEVWVGDFPGAPVANTPTPSAGDPGSIPGQGTNIPQAAWYSGKKKKWSYH